MRGCLVLCLVAGCVERTSTTTVKISPINECPTDRPIAASDLDCLCGISATIVDTTLSASCDELWCRAEDLELECITFGTTPTDTTPSETGDSGGSGG